jgi:hypothetical protein
MPRDAPVIKTLLMVDSPLSGMTANVLLRLDTSGLTQQTLDRPRALNVQLHLARQGTNKFAGPIGQLDERLYQLGDHSVVAGSGVLAEPPDTTQARR